MFIRCYGGPRSQPALVDQGQPHRGRDAEVLKDEQFWGGNKVGSGHAVGESVAYGKVRGQQACKAERLRVCVY